jgi:hypothetical protein
MINWVDDRFSRWGCWLQMGRGMGSAGLSASWGTVGRSNVRTAFIPIKSIEDSRTDDWVRALPVDDQKIMFEVYCTPHTAVDNARVLKMSTRTLYAKLHSLQVAYTRRHEIAEK